MWTTCTYGNLFCRPTLCSLDMQKVNLDALSVAITTAGIDRKLWRVQALFSLNGAGCITSTAMSAETWRRTNQLICQAKMNCPEKRTITRMKILRKMKNPKRTMNQMIMTTTTTMMMMMLPVWVPTTKTYVSV